MNIDPESYITVQGWMRTDLGLTGNELFAYAVIFGLSQGEDQWYTGSRQYIADWAGCSLSTVSRALESLVSNGLIAKKSRTENGVTFNSYKALVAPSQNDNSDAVPPSQNERYPLVKRTPNTIGINTIGKEKTPTESKRKRRKFAPPTVGEVKAYAESIGYPTLDAEHFVSYYEANGWMVGRNHMKDWRAAVRTWRSRDKATSKPKKVYVNGNAAAVLDGLDF